MKTKNSGAAWEIKIVSTILLTFRFRNAILHVIDIYLTEEVMKGVAYSFPCTFGLSISISIPVYPRTIPGYKGATKIPRFTTLAFGFRASVGSLDLSLSPWIPVLIGGPCFIDLYRIGQSASNWLCSRVWRNSQAEHNHFVWTVGYNTFFLFFWSLCYALCCFTHYKNLTFFKLKKWIYIGGNIFRFRFDLF